MGLFGLEFCMEGGMWLKTGIAIDVQICLMIFDRVWSFSCCEFEVPKLVIFRNWEVVEMERGGVLFVRNPRAAPAIIDQGRVK